MSFRLFSPLLALAAAVPSLAQVEEIRSLKARVENLESQNRQLVELVAGMKTRLDALAPVRPASAQSALPAAPPPRLADPESTLGSHFRLYGQLRLDMDIDSQRPGNPQTPLFITSPDPSSPGKSGDLSMHPRLTRFGIDFAGPTLGGLGSANLTGKLETDFENGGSESRQIIRIRHAWLKSTWNDFSILAGQTWDLFSPLFPTVNNDTLMWNAGNVGDRRPQLRAAYEPRVGKGQWSFATVAGLTGAVDPLDLDNNGYRDGEQSMRPDFQARIGYAHPLAKQMLQLGLSEFYATSQTARPAAGRLDFGSQALNIDFTLPLTARTSLRGEGWWGRGMSDVRGGAGQCWNSQTGRLIRGRGGWSELSFKVNRRWSLYPGFTTDDPVDGDLSKGFRTRNRTFYLGNRFTFDKAFSIGVDYLRWRTDYRDALTGIDNRVNIFFQYAY